MSMPPKQSKRVRVASLASFIATDRDFDGTALEVVSSKRAHTKNYHYFSEDEKNWIREALINWYNVEKRDLPWRKDIESEKRPGQRAYEVWVSEIMCQQTQIATVINYYNKWMKAFPTIQDLAATDLETVNKLWAGLGYYSRGKRLWEGARKIVENFDGVLPSDAVDLEKEVPGVGRYTAGAISSIAFGKQAELVDGNVIRVLARLRAISGNIKASSTIELFWELAKSLVPKNRPGDFNQGLMELGATVCTPQNPSCDKCPLRAKCHAFSEVHIYESERKHLSGKNTITKRRRGNNVDDNKDVIEECNICLPYNPSTDEIYSVTRYPLKAIKKPPRDEECAVCILERQWINENGTIQSEFLLTKRPEGGLLAGLWEFPSVELSTGSTLTYAERSALTAIHLKTAFGIKIMDDDTQKIATIIHKLDIGSVVHLFSHIRKVYHLEWVLVEDSNETMKNNINAINQSSYMWMTSAEMETAAIPTGHKKGIKVLENFRTNLINEKSTKSRKRTVGKGKKEPGTQDISNFFLKP